MSDMLWFIFFKHNHTKSGNLRIYMFSFLPKSILPKLYIVIKKNNNNKLNVCKQSKPM